MAKCRFDRVQAGGATAGRSHIDNEKALGVNLAPCHGDIMNLDSELLLFKLNVVASSDFGQNVTELLNGVQIDGCAQGDIQADMSFRGKNQNSQQKPTRALIAEPPRIPTLAAANWLS